jgi:hypothetical protein
MKRRIAVAGMVLFLSGILFELYLAQAMFRADIAAAFAMPVYPDEHVPPAGGMDLRCSAVLTSNEPGHILINLSNHSTESLPVQITLYIQGAAYTMVPAALHSEESIPPNGSVEKKWDITSAQADNLAVTVWAMERHAYYWQPKNCGIVVRELAWIPGKTVQRLSAASAFLGAVLLAPWLVEAWRKSRGKRLRQAVLMIFSLALGAALMLSIVLANAFRI